MKEYRAQEYDYRFIKRTDNYFDVYPYLRNDDGNKTMLSISPFHGRSFIVGRTDDGRFIVSKGNGLSFSQYNFLNTRERGDETLGLLLKRNAVRDFLLGHEIHDLGIKTNNIHCVIELDTEIILETGQAINPVLLQYDVECPYRLEDAAFVPQELLTAEVQKWESMAEREYEAKHLIAAEVLIKALRRLHDSHILHNALTLHNITWALELLDFEIASSPSIPYDTKDEEAQKQDLFFREIIDVYRIVCYIAWVLREPIEYTLIDQIFCSYGFDIAGFRTFYS